MCGLFGQTRRLIQTSRVDSKRAGNCDSQLVYRYPDEIPEFDCREIGEGYSEGGHEEWDHGDAGELM